MTLYIVLFVSVIVGWIVCRRWILPKLGIPS